MSVGEHSAAAFAEERTLCARPIAALRELMQVAKVRSLCQSSKSEEPTRERTGHCHSTEIIVGTGPLDEVDPLGIRVLQGNGMTRSADRRRSGLPNYKAKITLRCPPKRLRVGHNGR